MNISILGNIYLHVDVHDGFQSILFIEMLAKRPHDAKIKSKPLGGF
jgi:hypothetical protein